MRSSCPTSERRAGRRTAAALAVLLVLAYPLASARAQTAGADAAAALVVFPLVRFDSSSGLDTFLRLSNADDGAPLTARCFYENVNGSCLDNGNICTVDADCPGSECVPGFQVSDFQITLTAGQPVEWRAGVGLAVLPAPGNDGQIPPVAEDPFTGALRCVVVESTSGLPPVAGGPSGDSLEGMALLERRHESAVELARYRAIGFPSQTNDGDAVLEIGNEYGACPSTLSLDHLSEGAQEPIEAATVVRTELTLLPCGVDYQTAGGTPVSEVMHFSVFNEFEQRLGGNGRLTALLSTRLGDLHPTIFSVGVLGTLSAQTRINSVGGGVVGLSTRVHDRNGERLATPVFGFIHQGIRGPDPDLILLP